MMATVNIDQDCTFYYTTGCRKGDACLFRHEPAALQCFTTCEFWQKKKCRKAHCEFRHMELKKAEIPCYWETQPCGCQKTECPFRHSKARKNTALVPAAQVGGEPLMRAVPKAGVRLQYGTGRVPSFAACPEKDKKAEKRLKEKEKQLKKMKEKLKLAQEEHERELKVRQEEQDTEASYTLRALQEELDASINASTTCMTAAEDVVRCLGSTMREEFQCGICFELFISPVTLNCTHTFCEYCVTDWKKYSRECPVCREGITSMIKARNMENFIERTVSTLSDELKERRRARIAASKNDS